MQPMGHVFDRPDLESYPVIKIMQSHEVPLENVYMVQSHRHDLRESTTCHPIQGTDICGHQAGTTK
jgi:hypothetical protein